MKTLKDDIIGIVALLIVSGAVVLLAYIGTH
jgi:hypothetical protein